MRFSHLTAMVLIGGLHFIVPLVLILWTWGRGYASATAWAVQVLILISGLYHPMGSWVFASFYWRYAVIILALWAAIRSLTTIRGLPLFVK